MNVTLASWRQTWEQAGAASVDDSLFHLLVACYSEKHRHYHTLQHLRECFELFDEAKGMAGRPAEIGLALWFHDAIYDVRRYDNEARSADMAAASIRAAGTPAASAARTSASLAERNSCAPSGCR